jgi:hypothetical protein
MFYPATNTKDNLGFYKSTKDAATHFFFDKINKGTYVLEYDIRVNNKGNFSNGISTKHVCPEFSSHTNGLKVKSQIKQKTKPFQFLETVFLWLKNA